MFFHIPLIYIFWCLAFAWLLLFHFFLLSYVSFQFKKPCFVVHGNHHAIRAYLVARVDSAEELWNYVMRMFRDHSILHYIQIYIYINGVVVVLQCNILVWEYACLFLWAPQSGHKRAKFHGLGMRRRHHMKACGTCVAWISSRTLVMVCRFCFGVCVCVFVWFYSWGFSKLYHI